MMGAKIHNPIDNGPCTGPILSNNVHKNDFDLVPQRFPRPITNPSWAFMYSREAMDLK